MIPTSTFINKKLFVKLKVVCDCIYTENSTHRVVTVLQALKYMLVEVLN